MSTIITPSEEQINIVVNDEKISINVDSGDVIVNVNEQIVEVSTVNGGYPLPTTVYSVFGRTGNIIAVDGDYDLGELGDVTLVSSTNGDVLTYDGTKWINKAVTGTGTVTSVNMSVPVGLQVSGNPITINGTLALNYAAGYSLPTTAKQTTWDTAYNDLIISASVSGTTTKTLTLNQQDGGTITASWTDIDTNLVTSVNGYVGTVVLTTSDIAEGSRLYYTETRVSNNVDVAANTAARHSAVTIGTANGLSLASQVLSLALASASTTGALSSTDWATFNNKVPYSGATGNVTLGEYQLSAGQVAFDQSPTGTAGVGILRWNDSDGTLDLGLKGGNVTLQVGQEIVARVVNKTGADLLESGYKVVRISSAQGQRLAVQLAQANNDTNSTDTIGIVTETIVNNQEGFITILGQVKEINTTGSLQGETWADGDVLYLSPTTAGNITNIKPIAPSHMVVVGYVEYAHSQHGKIYCKTQNGYELEELHDCYLPTYVSNGVLYRDTTNNLWKNASIATVLGYTPISLTSLSGVSPLSYDNTTGAFSIAQATTSANGYLSSTDWNTFNGKQAALNGTGFVKATGTTISYDNSTYYLASNPNAYIALTGLSATAPLSYNNTTGGFTISQAGVSGNGYLSSTDWNTFNNKQAAGNYITALSGEATASGPGSAAVTLSTSAVTGKLLTGVNITGGSISATDSILVAFGKVQNQINGVLGGAIYQSTWNASTNSPTLTSSTGTKGYYYIVSVAGSTNLDGITDWKVGDWAIFNGATWDKVDNTDAVSSVNGFTGAVSLTTANISEVTNLYYTEGRVSANTDVAANTAARHAAVTLGTANGLSLSTQALSLGLASTSATGALSSTDWNTFNLKQAALSGTGFVKISGSTISYDNSTYLTTSAAASTYVPYTGATTNVALGSNTLQVNEKIGAFDNKGIYLRGISDPTHKIYYNTTGGNAIWEFNSSILFQFYNTASPVTRFTFATNGDFTAVGLLSASNFSGSSSGTNTGDQTLASLGAQAQLNGTGFVKASGTTISYDNSTYLTGNQTITLSGDVSGSGTTAITTTIGALKVTNAMLAGSIDLTTKVTGLLPDGNISSAATWNAKQNAITLTTTGTSGAATLVGNTLNIPNYAPDLSGYVTLATTQTISGAKTFSAALNGTTATFSTATSTTSQFRIENSSYAAGQTMGIDFTVAGGSKQAYVRAVVQDGTTAATDLVFGTASGGNNAATKLTLTALGNLGLGVTPSAWSTSFGIRVIDITNGCVMAATSDISLIQNGFFNSSGAFIYKTTDFATRYQQQVGEHRFYTAPLGTAGNAITFTQAMTLTASGNLVLGNFADDGNKLQVNGSAFIKSGNSLYIGNNTNANYWGIQSSGTGATALTFQYNSGASLLSIASTGAATFSGSVSATTLVANKLQISQTTGGSYITSNVAATTSLDVINTNTTNGYGLYVQGGVGSTSYALNVVNAANTVALFTVMGSGAATFSSSVTANGNIILKNNTSPAVTSGFTGLLANSAGLSFITTTVGASWQNDFIVSSGTANSYTFPNLTGTVAVMNGAGLLTTTSLQTSAPAGASAATWKLGGISNMTVTHDRVLYVEIGGTTYSILASTTI